jgi:hypothetical protein
MSERTWGWSSFVREEIPRYRKIEPVMDSYALALLALEHCEDEGRLHLPGAFSRRVGGAADMVWQG